MGLDSASENSQSQSSLLNARLPNHTARLAWCEMYILLANLFRRFELTIHDTTDADMEWVDLLLVQ